MKYALLNKQRIEPQKNIKNAICPICGKLVIPKCGNIKIHHWAHTTDSQCTDNWWENETEWHRQWKDNFPKECQEYIMHDDITGEKHIADVRTKTGFVIEFQHSSIKPEEQQSREQFYKNMVWIVDVRKQYDKFKQNIELLKHIQADRKYFYVEIHNKNCFPTKWLEAEVPVIFDFGVHDNINETEKQKRWLWCVFPEKYSKNLSYNCSRILCGMCIKKEDFINRVSLKDTFYPNIVLDELKNLYEKKKKTKMPDMHWLEKYLREEHWRKRIRDIALEQIVPVQLTITESGYITDSECRIYNNKKCLVLNINKELIILVEHEHKLILAAIPVSDLTIQLPSMNKFKYYFKTINVRKNENKFLLFLKNEDEIFFIEDLKKNLEHIEKIFSQKEY